MVVKTDTDCSGGGHINNIKYVNNFVCNLIEINLCWTLLLAALVALLYCPLLLDEVQLSLLTRLVIYKYPYYCIA